MFSQIKLCYSVILLFDGYHFDNIALWSESSSATIFYVYEQRRLWPDFADALARLSLR